VETLDASVVDCGVAKLALPRQSESGDRHLVRCTDDGVLIAAIDGIGHGKEAANAAKVATSVLNEGAEEPVISLVQHCHEKLRSTRGVVLSLASIDLSHGLMTWLGIGNVQGVLVHANTKTNHVREMLLLRGGVVGSLLPPLQATVLPIARGDTVYFATDGVRSDFGETLTARENPQKAADRILAQFHNGHDDALVLVARLTGARP
jgi:negative regulator of sigma-B (phosphoserine phosphatase)